MPTPPDTFQSLFEDNKFEPTLRDIFEARLTELRIPPSGASKILGTSLRSLQKILDGEQKLLDAVSLLKLGNFLQLPMNKTVTLYLEAVQRKYPVQIVSEDNIKFIKKNFDLAVLKKAGLIDSLHDIANTEAIIKDKLGLRSIFEYKKPRIDVAFSSGVVKKDNSLTRAFWVSSAKAIFEELDNPHPYDRVALTKFIPTLRRYSKDVKWGLWDTVKYLYKIGISVIYLPPLPTLRVRGATFCVYDKPCIVLSNISDFYATIWFSLMHELYHVLFDLDEISAGSYHISDDFNDQLSVREREKDADNFANEFLFPEERMNTAKHFINSPEAIEQIAQANNIDPSIIYTMYAYLYNEIDTKAWARVKKNTKGLQLAVGEFPFLWNDLTPLSDTVKTFRTNLESNHYEKAASNRQAK